MKDSRKHAAACALSALLCASALTMDISPIQVSTENSPSLALRVANLAYGVAGALSENPVSLCLIALGAFFFFRRCLYKGSQSGGVLDKLLAFLLGLFMLLSKGLLAKTQVSVSESEKLVSCARTIFVLWAGNTQVVKSLICLAGFYCLWLAVIHAAQQGLDVLALQKPFRFRRPFATPFCLLLACWMAQAVLRYPGAIWWDTTYSLGEFFGERAFIGINPPMHVLLCGWFAQLGEWLGNLGVGLFLLTLIQTLVFALVVAYSLWLFQKWRLPKVAIWGGFLMTMLLPTYSAYATTLAKDSSYSIMFLLFLLQLTLWLVHSEQFWAHGGLHLLLWALSAVLMIWMRKNGLYVVTLCVALVILPVSLFRRHVQWRRFLPGLCILAAVALAVLGENALETAYGVGGGSRREMLSLHFQQTARLLREHGQDIPKEEIDVIDQVLAANEIAELYQPNISDRVKETFREDATADEVKAYFVLWLEQGLRYPLVYLDATVNMMHNLFSPLGDSPVYYRSASGHVRGVELMTLSEGQPFQNAGELCFSLYRLLSALPGFNLLVNIGFAFDMLLVLCYVAIQKRQRALWGVLLPLLISAGVIFLSPICYTRYALPLLYGLPVVFAACLALCRQKGEVVSPDTTR